MNITDGSMKYRKAFLCGTDAQDRLKDADGDALKPIGYHLEDPPGTGKQEKGDGCLPLLDRGNTCNR